MRNFIAIGPNGWGKGFTPEQAVRRMKKAVPHWHGKTYRYETFECHPDTEVGDLGDLSYPRGCPPISLGVTNPVKRGAKRVYMTKEQKLEYAETALQKIREMGYSSEAHRATDTVLACVRVAEDALRTVRVLPRKTPPSAAVIEAIEVAAMGSR